MSSGSFVALVPATASNGKPYYKMHWTADDRGPKQDNIFDRNQLKLLQELKAGDRITVNKIKKGDYWNIDSISREAPNNPAPVVNQPAPQPAPQQQARSYNNDPYMKPKSPEEQHAIARAVALDKAVSFVGALVAADKYKKTATPDIIWFEVDKYTALMYDYLVGNRQIKDIVSDVTGVTPSDGETDDEIPF